LEKLFKAGFISLIFKLFCRCLWLMYDMHATEMESKSVIPEPIFSAKQE